MDSAHRNHTSADASGQCYEKLRKKTKAIVKTQRNTKRKGDRKDAKNKPKTAKTSIHQVVRRGRPPENPDYVPHLVASIADAPQLAQFKLKSASCAIQEDRQKKRLQKQVAKAKRLGEQRNRDRIFQLEKACTEAKVQLEAHKRKEERRLQQLHEEEKKIDQVLVAVHAGEIPIDEAAKKIGSKKVLNRLKQPRPHTSEDTRRLVRELADEYSQREIAKGVGITQPAVCYILKSKPTPHKRGRKKILTAAMEEDVARYRFLFHTHTIVGAQRFIQQEFGINVYANTIQKAVKRVGFRLGDFKHYPRDRNSDDAVSQRYRYATEMPEKYGDALTRSATVPT